MAQIYEQYWSYTAAFTDLFGLYRSKECSIGIICYKL